MRTAYQHHRGNDFKGKTRDSFSYEIDTPSFPFHQAKTHETVMIRSSAQLEENPGYKYAMYETSFYEQTYVASE